MAGWLKKPGLLLSVVIEREEGRVVCHPRRIAPEVLVVLYMSMSMDACHEVTMSRA